VLREHLRPGDTFVDVGANVGYLSVVAASLVGSSGHVHAFEPNDRLGALLRDSARANGLGHLHVNETGLWSSSGSLVLRVEPSSAHSYLRVDAADARPTDLRVPVTTLDDYLDLHRRPPVRLVKIDVEGAELHVLRGALRCLERDHPLLVLEVLDWGLARFGDDAEGVFAFLQNLGYGARDLDGAPVSDAREALARLETTWIKNLVFEAVRSGGSAARQL
jgi:FkbM family methyltransferase